jgi:glycerol-3-phosphate dehydrogenase
VKRDLAALEGRIHDLLVVGAGIHGACIARDAALRGLSAALIDRGDLGAATSHNSLKILHGGLRYLQHLDLVRLRQSAREQRHWLKIAPHLTRILPFVMPTHGHGTRGPEAMRAALALHGLVARAGAEARVGPRLPRGRILSRGQCLELIPGLAAPRLSGGALWHEAQLVEADRALLECVQDAADHGAAIATYLTAEGFLGPAGEVQGVRGRDLEGGAPVAIRARLTVNACGPFAGDLLGRLGAPARGFGGLAKGLNLVVRRPLPGGHAIAVSSRRRSDSLVPRGDGRLYFLTPWQGRTVIGTSHLPYDGAADAYRFAEADIEGFLAEINAAWPAAALARDDVLYAYAGLTPAEGESGGEVRRARRGQVIDHARDGTQGLLSVQGVKYTTARLVAEGVVDLALARLGCRAAPCRTAELPLPGASTPAPPAGDLAAAVRRAVREELALRLEDVVLRRLGLAAQGRLGAAEIATAAGVMAEELGWSASRRARERAAVAALLARHHGRPSPAAEGEHHAA